MINYVDGVPFLPVFRTVGTNLPMVVRQLCERGGVVIAHSGVHTGSARLVGVGSLNGRLTQPGFPSISETSVVSAGSFNFMRAHNNMGISLVVRGREAPDEDGEGYPFRGDILMSGDVNYGNLVADTVSVDNEESVEVGLSGNIEIATGMTLLVVVSAERVVITAPDGSKRQRFSGDAGVGEIDEAMWRGNKVSRMIFNISGATIVAMPRVVANELWPRHEVNVQGYTDFSDVPTGKEDIIIDRDSRRKLASSPRPQLTNLSGHDLLLS